MCVCMYVSGAALAFQSVLPGSGCGKRCGTVRKQALQLMLQKAIVASFLLQNHLVYMAVQQRLLIGEQDTLRGNTIEIGDV